jgi:hypothetical protein
MNLLISCMHMDTSKSVYTISLSIRVCMYICVLVCVGAYYLCMHVCSHIIMSFTNLLCIFLNDSIVHLVCLFVFLSLYLHRLCLDLIG